MIKILPKVFGRLREDWSNLCLKVVFPEYQMFVLVQNIERINSNSAKNHNSSWQAKRKIKKIGPKFLIFLKFCVLEATVVWSEISG